MDSLNLSVINNSSNYPQQSPYRPSAPQPSSSVVTTANRIRGNSGPVTFVSRREIGTSDCSTQMPGISGSQANYAKLSVKDINKKMKSILKELLSLLDPNRDQQTWKEHLSGLIPTLPPSSFNQTTSLEEIASFLDETLQKILSAKNSRTPINLEDLILSFLQYPILHSSPERFERLRLKEEMMLCQFKYDIEHIQKREIARLEYTLTRIRDTGRILQKFFSRSEKDDYVLLGPEGAKMLVQKMKETHPNLVCTVCESPMALEKEMKKFASSGSVGKNSFLVFGGNVRPGSSFAHVTPVVMEKNAEGLIKIAILDSTGSTKENDYHAAADHHYVTITKDNPGGYEQNIYYALRDWCLREDTGFQLNLDTCPEIYIFTERRQSNGFTCPFFSMNDIIQFFRSPNFFYDIEDHGGNFIHGKKDKKVIYFSLLPPEFMKLTQSYKVIDTYKDNSSADTAVLEEKCLSFSKRDDTDKIVFVKAQMRYIAFLHYMNQHLVKNYNIPNNFVYVPPEEPKLPPIVPRQRSSSQQLPSIVSGQLQTANQQPRPPLTQRVHRTNGCPNNLLMAPIAVLMLAVYSWYLAERL